MPSARVGRRLLGTLWLAATAALLVMTALGVLRKVTWYLAVDQYGYLTFAHDLMHGQIFHDWPPLHALASRLFSPVDVLFQTYIYDQGRLHCRYSPGFPIILAGWLRLFGDDGAHYLNPTVFILLLLVALAFQTAVFRSRWRALAGVALIVLCPTGIHLWSLTLVRDLPTHLVALTGLTLLVSGRRRGLDARRIAAAGLALGYAGSIRPDAVLYLAPAALMTAGRWWRERPGSQAVVLRAGAGVLAVALGLAPFFAYNRIATGSMFRPTQGMEIENFWTTASAAGSPEPAVPAGPVLARVGFPSGAWYGGTGSAIQGGGLRLANLPVILPLNLGILRGAYGDLLLGIAIWGAVLALFQRRLLFLGPVVYCLLAIPFYSCWSRPDPRYLSGVHVFMPMLIVEGVLGTLDLVRRLAAGRATVAQGVAATAAALLAGGAWAFHAAPVQGALPVLFLLVPGVAAAAALAAAFRPRMEIASVAAPVLALALVTVSCVRTAQSLDARATFQRPAMVRARATFAQAVEPEAVVITTEDVGRPGENIDYYSRVAHALYLTDLERWHLTIGEAAELLARDGIHPYLLIPSIQPGHDRILHDLQRPFTVELAADIPASKAIDYFVAARFYPQGIHMELYRLHWRGLWWPLLP
jgi:hypothetical protein